MKETKNSFYEELKDARQIEVNEQYYANTYKNNIYGGSMEEKHVRMFCRGEGGELIPKDGKKEKAASLYSSSMLAYNFFSWIDKANPLMYEGVKYNKVVFEEQFRVLKNRNNKANLDVLLLSEDNKTLLLLESKFTEHLALKKEGPKMSIAYEMPESYYCYGDDWVNAIKRLKEMPKVNDEKRYYEGLKQVVCHLIGISSVIHSSNARGWYNKNSWLHYCENIHLDGNERFLFKSIVFHPKMEEESKQSLDYEELNTQFVGGLNFLPTNLLLENPIITYRQLWDKGMKESIKDEKLVEFLGNYLQVHA